MNILFEDSITDEIRNKYILLQLDTFYFSDIDSDRTAYCLIENTPIMEMVDIDRSIDLHHNLMRNYKKKNWFYCETAIENLKGRWNKELDTFYNHLLERINEYKETELSSDWNGSIRRD
jgi:hypothetical protein